MSIRHTAVFVLATASLFCSLSVEADPTRPPEQVSRPVALSGIDLSTPAGLVAAQARIDDAARRLCRQFEDSRRVSSRATYADCVRDTRTAALRQIEQRAPTALAAAPDRH